MKTWRERVAERKISLNDRDDAWGFRTCAVGEWHHKLPDVVVYIDCKGGTGPKDVQLFELGCKFPRALERRDWKEAEALLDKIEDRVLELKRAQ